MIFGKNPKNSNEKEKKKKSEKYTKKKRGKIWETQKSTKKNEMLNAHSTGEKLSKKKKKKSV